MVVIIIHEHSIHTLTYVLKTNTLNYICSNQTYTQTIIKREKNQNKIIIVKRQGFSGVVQRRVEGMKNEEYTLHD